MCVCLQNRLDSKAPFYRTFIQLVTTQVLVSNSSVTPQEENGDRTLQQQASGSGPLSSAWPFFRDALFYPFDLGSVQSWGPHCGELRWSRIVLASPA